MVSRISSITAFTFCSLSVATAQELPPCSIAGTKRARKGICSRGVQRAANLRRKHFRGGHHEELGPSGFRSAK